MRALCSIVRDSIVRDLAMPRLDLHVSRSWSRSYGRDVHVGLGALEVIVRLVVRLRAFRPVIVWFYYTLKYRSRLNYY